MKLPKPEELKLYEDLVAYERSQNVPHINFVERIGMEKGLKKGLEDGDHRARLQTSLKLSEPSQLDVPVWSSTASSMPVCSFGST